MGKWTCPWIHSLLGTKWQIHYKGYFPFLFSFSYLLDSNSHINVEKFESYVPAREFRGCWDRKKRKGGQIPVSVGIWTCPLQDKTFSLKDPWISWLWGIPNQPKWTWAGGKGIPTGSVMANSIWPLVHFLSATIILNLQIQYRWPSPCPPQHSIAVE